MQPIHSLEYEMTSDLASQVHRTLVRWQLRRGWWKDVPVLVGAIIFTALIVWLGLEGWVLPGVAGGLMCVVMLFVLGALFRRWSMSYGAAGVALLALGTPDRRVRLEFAEDRVRLETEFFRGEGAWTELDEVVIFPDFWLLNLANGGQILIPLSRRSPELEAFLRAKAQEFAAPIRQGA
jgi:hypothetical protein